MNTKVFFTCILIVASILATMVSKASDIDSSKVEKKIIKIVKVDDKGTVIIDSTYTCKDGKVIIMVDSSSYDATPCKMKMIQHTGKNHVMSWNDQSGKTYNMEINTDGDSTSVTVVGEPNSDDVFMMPEMGAVPHCKKIMIAHEGEDFPMPPAPPIPPIHFSNNQGMIDLNDPSIISFEKKVQKNGTEKITIVRKIE